MIFKNVFKDIYSQHYKQKRVELLKETTVYDWPLYFFFYIWYLRDKISNSTYSGALISYFTNVRVIPGVVPMGAGPFPGVPIDLVEELRDVVLVQARLLSHRLLFLPILLLLCGRNSHYNRKNSNKITAIKWYTCPIFLWWRGGGGGKDEGGGGCEKWKKNGGGRGYVAEKGGWGRVIEKKYLKKRINACRKTKNISKKGTNIDLGRQYWCLCWCGQIIFSQWRWRKRQKYIHIVVGKVTVTPLLGYGTSYTFCSN